MKRRKRIIFFLIIIALLLPFGGYTIDAIVESSQIQKMIDTFKKDCTFYQYSSYYDTNFYIKKTDNKDITPTFTIKDDLIYPGYQGDILTTLKNEVAFEPLTSIFSFYFGGHAAMVQDDLIIQTAGNNPGNNYVDYYPNNWLRDHTKRYRFIALKVKTSEETRKKACEQTVNWLYKKYNYTFIFNTKDRFYCTDLISRAYQEADSSICLNEDAFTVSVQDLITSSDTFISIYKEPNPIEYTKRKQNEAGNYNVYFLEDYMTYSFDKIKEADS